MADSEHPQASGDGLDRPFMPPHDHRAPRRSLTAGLLAGLLLLAAYAAYLWWKEPPPATSSPPKPPLPVRAPSAPSAPSVKMQTPASAAPPASRTVHKCISNGKTSYSDAPCPSGYIASMITLPVDATPTPRRPSTEPPRNPPVNAPAPDFVPPSELARPELNNQTECRQLQTYIQELDAAARQPLSMPAQDDIRRKRQEARDRQFRIKC